MKESNLRTYGWRCWLAAAPFVILHGLSACAHQEREPEAATGVTVPPDVPSDVRSTEPAAPPPVAASEPHGWPGATGTTTASGAGPARPPAAKRRELPRPEGERSDTAGAPARAPTPESKGRASSAANGQAVLGEALSNELSQSLAQLMVSYEGFATAIELGEPDCVSAARLRQTVCELAERICRLEAPISSNAPERHCEDGRKRCADVSARYSARCP